MKFSSRSLAGLLACSLAPFAGAVTYTVPTTMGTVNSTTLGGTPVGGDIIIISAGARGRLTLQNLTGAAGNPIIIKNSTGLCQITDAAAYGVGINVITCKYFRLTGTGDPTIPYGFKVSQTDPNGNGIAFGTKTEEYEADHLEVCNTGFAGIMSKTDPSCSNGAEYGLWIQHNVLLHDNYIHDVGGEAFYCGNSFWGNVVTDVGVRSVGVWLDCNGIPGDGPSADGKETQKFPHSIQNCHIYDNIVMNTGWDGIQMACVELNGSIHDNYIYNYGTKNTSGQRNGIQVGGGCAAHVYNNVIHTGKGNGIAMFGLGGNRVYNNLIYQPDEYGVYCADVDTASNAYYFTNNTIVEPGNFGVSFRNQYANSTEWKGNIVVHPQRLVVPQPPTFTYVGYMNGASMIVANNQHYPAVSDLNFVSPATLDFHLLSSSVAVNTGVNYAAYTFDQDNLTRIGTYDCGAYEQTGAVFNQDFSGPPTLTNYYSATNPTAGQFNDINAEADGGTWTVTGGGIQLQREASTLATNGAGFTRSTDFANNPTVLHVKFSMSVSNLNMNQNDVMVMDFGGVSVSDYNNSTPSVGVMCSLRVDASGSHGFKYEVSGVQSAVHSANGTLYKLQLFMNKDAVNAASYKGPNGVVTSLPAKKVHVWVGTTKILDVTGSYYGGAANPGPLTDIRTRLVAGDAGIWRFDDFVVHSTLPQ